MNLKKSISNEALRVFEAQGGFSVLSRKGLSCTFLYNFILYKGVFFFVKKKNNAATVNRFHLFMYSTIAFLL